jgi:hypothetical protein
MSPPDGNSRAILRDRIVGFSSEKRGNSCVLRNHAKILLPSKLASHIAIGDEITFAIPDVNASGTEAFVTKDSNLRSKTCIYLAPIRYATQPRVDKHGQSFVSASVRNGALGLTSIFLPCAALREYFFGICGPSSTSGTLYETLRIRASSSPAEIRVAFKLRALELEAFSAPRDEHVKLERAFNILGHAELRPHYDTLLSNPETPAVFPYGGFGSLLVSGYNSEKGDTFFAKHILAFVPEQVRRRFQMLLRNCEFYADRALYSDPRRRLQFWIDPALMPIAWEQSWNRWKHLLSTRFEVDGAFVRSSRYRKRSGAWERVDCDTGLPSRLSVKLPADFRQDIERARTIYCRFGQYSRALDQIRLCLEHKAIERKDLERMCSGLGIPGDFDVAQINWRPDYNPFFYNELSRRARRIYLFGDEYVFEVERAIVVETPRLGHATYVFARPRNVDNFLALYTKTSKTEIRRNGDNIAERLGFLERIVHTVNPRVWLNEISERIGEKAKLLE